MKNLLMVVLAKSYKPGGRCIAGRLVKYTVDKKVWVGSWVRPVADDETGHGALSNNMYCFEDGSEVKVLDIVEIPVTKHYPIEGQPENYVINSREKWIHKGSLRADSIPYITEKAGNIWNDPNSESHKVSATYNQSGLISQSLYLVKPSNLFMTLSNEFNNYKQKYKKKIVANFTYEDVNYQNISVTCPCVRRILTNRYPQEGQEPITFSLMKGDNYVLCMSLSPKFGSDNDHYKLVATVFDFDGYLQRKYAA